MTSLRDSAVLGRHRDIIMMCKEQPYTIRGLQEVLGGSYHTIRNDVLALVEKQELRSVGLHAGSRLFSAKHDALTGWPIMFDNEAKTRGKGLKEVSNIYRRNRTVANDTLKATFIAMRQFTKTILWANDIRTGHGFDKDIVNNAKKELVLCRGLLMTLVHRVDSMLANERLWTKPGLEELTLIEDFPDRETLKGIEEVEMRVIMEVFDGLDQLVTDRLAKELEERNEASSAEHAAGG